MKFRRNEVDIKKFTIDKEKIEKFKDDMSYMNIIPKDFSKKRLKSCPICGGEVENWTIKSRWTLLDKMYDFTCPKCQSTLTIGESDITGLSYTGASICGQVKKMHNKEMREVYVKCKRINKELASNIYRVMNLHLRSSLRKCFQSKTTKTNNILKGQTLISN